MYRLLPALVTLLVAACGGGGGGGGLSLRLAPDSLTQTLYQGGQANLVITGTVSGTASDPITVVIVDNVGVIEAFVLINQVSDNVYEATLKTLPGLTPGRYRGVFQVVLCGVGCTPEFTRAQIPFDFTVLPGPTIASVSPNSTVAGGPSFTLTVDGANFVPTSIVNFLGSDRPATFVSDSRLTAQINAADILTARADSVLVRNPIPNGSPAFSNIVPFAVNNPVPLLGSLSPGFATVGSANLNLTVNGINFNPSSVIEIDGNPQSTQLISPSQLVALLPAGELATGRLAKVRVRNGPPGGGVSAEGNLSIAYPPPLISSLNPSSVLAGSPATLVQVSGTNIFLPATTVEVNGITRTPIAGTTIRLEASELANGGTIAIALSNPSVAGSNSSSLDFTVWNPVPTVSGLDPESTTAGCSSLTLGVNGSGFVPSSVVRRNGVALPTTFVSPNRLLAQVQAAELAGSGTANVSVVNPSPAGGSSGTASLTVNATGPVTSSTVAYQVDPGHRGEATIRCPSALPSAPTWTASIDGSGFYPLVAGNRVFVSTSDGSGSEPKLFALDASNGNTLWGPVTAGGVLAYDAGKVFAGGQQIFTGTVRAFDAATGSLLWTQTITDTGGLSFGTLTAADGRVYANIGGHVVALNQSDGTILWDPIGAGGTTFPAVTDDGVFIGNTCFVAALDPATGNTLWTNSFGCTTGAGDIPVAGGGSVFALVAGSGFRRFDTVTGNELAQFNGLGATPAVAGNTAFFVINRLLRSVDTTTGATIRNFLAPQNIDTAPLVINDAVLVGSEEDRFLSLQSIAQDRELWRLQILPPKGPRGISDWPPRGFTVGEGLLVVPGFNVVRAYRLGE